MYQAPTSVPVRKLLAAARKPKSKWTEELIASRIREGYGQGTGRHYKSWLTFRDLSSKGRASRFYSIKLDRQMVFFSDIELRVFLVAEFLAGFVDFWENYPLSRQATTAAARALRVRHPRYPNTQVPTVMTLDGVVTVVDEQGLFRRSVDSKQESDARTATVSNKLSIHARASQELGWPHARATEKSVSHQVAKTIMWIRAAVPHRASTPPFPGAFDIWPERFLSMLRDDIAVSPPQLTIARYCAAFDAEQQLQPGSAMTFLRILLWRKQLAIPLESDKASLLPLGVLFFPDPLEARLFKLAEEMRA
ncbi:TnsA endonuclease N-terminal domain-containing protein [Pseudorhodoferax soli]|uniref:TnsA endonuclease-like protein n=1 Tax=Pseudorhodoferax soli TaxID=545864 RepID=A0A368XMH8_9BURK|nr:TnsA endonuclease N-terminal domain-containing protein [Pseudorhodoferax soli]RCW69211.1 TnsA endonuclease-like protein [Pseudorhodoferax soli]